MSNQPKQFLFVSHRNITIGSTQGYSIEFQKGVPTHVPRAMHAEVMEKGVLPCDAKGETLDAPEASKLAPDAPRVMVAPEDPEERKEKILEVIKALCKTNSSKDFSAGGVPSATSVSMALGWKVDAKEIRPIWAEFKPTLEGQG